MLYSADLDNWSEFRIESAVPLVFNEGAPVRSGSSLAWTGRRLLIAQDNAWSLALADPETGVCDPLPLRPGATVEPVAKAIKPDFEAIASLAYSAGARGPALRYLVFASGSSPQRRTVVRVTISESSAQASECAAFYRALEDTPEFSGSELNLEGVLCVTRDSRAYLRLFQRGNGKTVSGRGPVNATADVDAESFLDYWSRCGQGSDDTRPPRIENIRQYDLGSTGGTPLSFTDAALGSDDGIYYVAAAEACPDVIADGPCRGVVIGRIAPDGCASHALLLEPDGCPSVRKAEGLAFDPADASRLLLVVDADDPEAASELVTVRMRINPDSAIRTPQSALVKGNHV